ARRKVRSSSCASSARRCSPAASSSICPTLGAPPSCASSTYRCVRSFPSQGIEASCNAGAMAAENQRARLPGLHRFWRVRLIASANRVAVGGRGRRLRKRGGRGYTAGGGGGRRLRKRGGRADQAGPEAS